jgi:signal transduction histidine kinase
MMVKADGRDDHVAVMDKRPLVWLRQRVADLLPPETPAPGVVVTLPLAAFIGALALASVVGAVFSFQPVTDMGTLILGGLVLLAASYGGVRATGGVDVLWNAGVFVHLALALTYGPLGAMVAAGANAAAVAARVRPGWVRTVFNLSDLFLSDLAAWFTFTHVAGMHQGVLINALAATLAGAVQCVVNHALLAVVIQIASGGSVSARRSFTNAVRSSILYNIGYGWAAYGAVLLHQIAGTVGFTTTLLPVILLQGFLLLLARRIRAQDLERAAHTKEREALLQQAIDASDAERKRIASDLHDGVVQTLAGLAFSLAARGSAASADPLMLEAAGTLRSSVTDLRTLMIEIAPPDLAVSGIDSALRKLLEPLPAKGIEVEVDAAAATHLPADKTSLVFRVAQEAIRNVVNHSQATKVITTLRYADGKVTLHVEDNGKGFSAADRSRRRDEGHVGLSLLNNAVEASSGRLSLESEPGRGTSLMLELPC